MFLDLWTFWTVPSPPSPVLSMAGGSCLSPESIPSFSFCPALLPNCQESSCCPQEPPGTWIDCARSPDPSICFQEFSYLDLNILVTWFHSDLCNTSPPVNVWKINNSYRPQQFLKGFSLTSLYLWCCSCSFKGTALKAPSISTSSSKTQVSFLSPPLTCTLMVYPLQENVHCSHISHQELSGKLWCFHAMCPKNDGGVPNWSTRSTLLKSFFHTDFSLPTCSKPDAHTPVSGLQSEGRQMRSSWFYNPAVFQWGH